MTFRTWFLAATLLAAAGPALAGREPFDDLFFVKHGGTAAGMFADRSTCRGEALALDFGSSAAAYSNPQYGALAAMGAALDSDALHSGGLKKRMQRAALVSCMHRLGWEERELGDGDRAVARATPGKPEALAAWLKTHEPPPPAAPDTAAVEAKADAKTGTVPPPRSSEPPAYVKAMAARPAVPAPTVSPPSTGAALAQPGATSP